MTAETKTKVMGIVSWALPVESLLEIMVLGRVFRPQLVKSLLSIVFVFGLLLARLVLALVLAILARRRSRLLHGGKFRGHATAGLFVSLPLFICYSGVFVLILLSALGPALAR